MVDPYQRQVAPQRTSGSVPFANEQQMGGGIGDALSGIGNALGDNAIADLRLKQQQDRDLAAAAAFKGAAELKERVGLASLDAQDNAAPGAAGFSRSMADLLDKENGAFIQSIADPVVRRRYEAAMQEWSSEQRLRFEGYERGQTAKLGVTNYQVGSDMIANRVSRNATTQEFDDAIKDIRIGLAEMKGVPADVLAALEREGVAKVAYSYLAGIAPNEAKAALGSGLFDRLLPPAAIERLNSNADVEIRRAQVELEAQQRAQVTDTREDLNLLIKQLGDGAVVPPETIDALIVQAKSLGLDNQGYDLEGYQIQNNLNRQYPPGTSLRQIEQAMLETDTAIAKSGDNVPASLARARDHLDKMLSARREAMGDDPLGYGAAAGYEIGSLDPNEPASYRQRAITAVKISKSTGAPIAGYLPTEVDEWKAKVEQPSGRLELVNDVLKFGDAKVITAAMRQIVPSDPVLQHSLTLKPEIRRALFEGEAALKDKRATVPAADAREAWSPFRKAFPSGSADFQSAVYQSAIRLYARDAARRGLTEFDEDLFEGAISAAAGGEVRGGVRYGGIGEYEGRKMLLPPKMSQSEFDRRLSNFKPTTAVHGNGDPVTGRELRERFWPVRMSGSRYRFVNARGEYVGQRKGGEPYWVDIATVPLPTVSPRGRSGMAPDAAPVYRAAPQQSMPRGPVYRAAPSEPE